MLDYGTNWPGRQVAPATTPTVIPAQAGIQKCPIGNMLVFVHTVLGFPLARE